MRLSGLLGFAFYNFLTRLRWSWHSFHLLLCFQSSGSIPGESRRRSRVGLSRKETDTLCAQLGLSDGSGSRMCYQMGNQGLIGFVSLEALSAKIIQEQMSMSGSRKVGGGEDREMTFTK